MEKRSWIATAAGVLGGLALFDAVVGPLGAMLGLLAPMTGFRLLLLGLLAAVLALLLGLVGLLRTGSASGRRGRGLAWLGVVGGGALVAIVGAQVLATGDVPRINDITTDPDDPPLFFAGPADPELRDLDWSYEGADFAVQQRAAYPDLAPIELDTAPSEAFPRAVAAAEALGWDLVASDPVEMRFEARATSRLFRFVDDVIVRIRPAEGGGSVVDVRSQSRDGQSDLGVNAARIRTFATKLREG